MEQREAFLNLVTTKTGTISSNAIREEYFVKRGKSDLWNWFLEETKEYDDWTIPQRVNILREGVQSPRPMCRTCGEYPIQFLNRKVSEYCSKVCASKDNKNVGVAWKDRDAGINKRKETNLKKYGVEFHTQTDEWRKSTSERMSKSHLSNQVNLYLCDANWLFTEYVLKSRTAHSIADSLGVHCWIVLRHMVAHGIHCRTTSKNAIRDEITLFINQLGVSTQTSIPSHLSNDCGIEVYIESHQLGISINSLYQDSPPTPHHSVNDVVKTYNKTISAKSHDIRLIHVTDEQWNFKPEIVKSIIRSKLDITNRIMARKTKVVCVSSKEANKFFSSTHIQGFVSGKHYFALEFNGKYVAMMSFGTPRYDKSYDVELLRYSSDLNTTVVGGFSKLLKYYISINPAASIISYADARRSDGEVYRKNGFTFIKSTSPGYGYTDGEVSYNRNNYQKNKLINLLENFDPNLTESENMYNHNFRKFYDCGQLVFGISPTMVDTPLTSV